MRSKTLALSVGLAATLVAAPPGLAEGEKAELPESLERDRRNSARERRQSLEWRHVSRLPEPVGRRVAIRKGFLATNG